MTVTIGRIENAEHEYFAYTKSICGKEEADVGRAARRGEINAICLDLLIYAVAQTKLEALDTRLRIRYALRPLSLEESGYYITHGLKNSPY